MSYKEMYRVYSSRHALGINHAWLAASQLIELYLLLRPMLDDNSEMYKLLNKTVLAAIATYEFLQDTDREAEATYLDEGDNSILYLPVRQQLS